MFSAKHVVAVPALARDGCDGIELNLGKLVGHQGCDGSLRPRQLRSVKRSAEPKAKTSRVWMGLRVVLSLDQVKVGSDDAGLALIKARGVLHVEVALEPAAKIDGFHGAPWKWDV